VTYASAEEFLDDPARTLAACLVLDVHLAGMSGFDLQERLDADASAPPVIFVTAHENPEYPERARALGSRALFTKPVAGSALLEAIRQTVETRAPARE
jgi:FixJ family two-component response regulator